MSIRDKNRVYRSKIDTWLLVAIIFVVASSLYACIEILRTETNMLSLLVIGGLGVILPVWLLAGTGYVLHSEQLVVHAGPFRWRVPLKDITSITPTRNPLASPALSLDRLRIEYGHGKWVMISPRDKEQLMRDITDATQDWSEKES
ncbi:PH domain-containing protein [Aliidiomarina sp. Khilg15.8]